MVDCSHMFAVCIKQNDKKKRMGETRGVEEVVGNRLWNRPALCCTWSPGLYERPPRISSLDTSVSKYHYFPWSFLSIFFKRRVSFAFPAASTWVCSVVFVSWFNYLRGAAFPDKCWTAEMRKTLILWHVVCLIYGDPRNSSQQSHTSPPALLSLLWSAPKLLFVSTWTSMFS